MNQNNYLKVGIYIRLSKEDKDKINKDDDSESIKNQRHMLLDYINKNPSYHLVDEYCDEDLSGAGTYRPEFTRLINDCKNRKLDIVLCKSQSRFSRDMEIIEKYLHNKFKEWHIRFISLSDNADTENQGNKKARQINGLVNEWYLEDISNNIRSAFNIKMKQGELISPFAPFGYDINPLNNNQLIIDPLASTIVNKIYNLYLQGYGYTKIANYLNKQNYPSPSYYKYQKGSKLNIVSSKNPQDIKWSSNAIKTILTNEIYIGNLIQGKRTTISYKNHKVIKKETNKWIKDLKTHEPIINKKIFNKVQKLIKQRSKIVKKTNIIHPFTGKVYCLECHHLMRKKNSSKHQYLFCPNTCPNSSIRYDTLEQIILKEINNLLNKYYDKNLIAKYYSQTKNDISQNKINLLQKEKIIIKNNLHNNLNYLQKLYEDKINNLITNDEFTILTKIYKQNKIKYTNQLKYINKEIHTHQNKKDFPDKYYLTKLNNIIIDEFISKILIGKIKDKQRKIKIIWNF